MDALSSFLSSLGPWGVLIGAAIPIIVNLIRDRVSPQPPRPDPNQAPVPGPSPSGTPVLDAILQILRAKLTPAPPAVPVAASDIAHEDAAELLLKLFKPPALPAAK